MELTIIFTNKEVSCPVQGEPLSKKSSKRSLNGSQILIEKVYGDLNEFSISDDTMDITIKNMENPQNDET